VTRSHGGPRNSVAEDKLLAPASSVRNVDAGGRGGADEDEDEDETGTNCRPTWDRRQNKLVRELHHLLLVVSVMDGRFSTSTTVQTSNSVKERA
jgi:hypothetical protein